MKPQPAPSTTLSSAETGRELVILIPVFDDWESLALLLAQLAPVLNTLAYTSRILVIDDGSPEPMPLAFKQLALPGITALDVLVLRRNLGHQRAIAVGLAYVEANLSCWAVVIMDGDGEDAPTDLTLLLERYLSLRQQKIIFAARARRSEGWLFTVGYRTFRVVHLLLTGIPVRIGNYSVIPRTQLSRLVVVSDLWNHYAASVIKARLPYDAVNTARAKRLAGASHMNFLALVLHGLSAISVFGDRVGVRLLAAVTALMALILAMMVSVVVIRLATDWAIPGWATYTMGILAQLLGTLFMLMLVFVFITLGTRDNLSFLPLRDHVFFIEKVEAVISRHDHS